MVEIQRDHEVAEDSSGKSLHHVARFQEPRPGPGPDKSVIDIVTDDYSIYRFARHTPGELWAFEPGTGNPEDRRMSRSGRLPSVVEAIIESEAEGVAGEWGNGVRY